MFDDEDLGVKPVGTSNTPLSDLHGEQDVKILPEAKSAKKTRNVKKSTENQPDGDEVDDEDDAISSLQTIQQVEKSLPDYEFFGDFSFAQKIYDLFSSNL